MCKKLMKALSTTVWYELYWKKRWELLTCTHSNLISWLVSWEVAVHAFVGVTDVSLIARFSDLPCTTLAAATAIQDRAHPWSAERSFLTLTRPLAKLPSLRNRLPISGGQLCIILSTAETLWENEDNTTHVRLRRDFYSRGKHTVTMIHIFS